MILSDKYNKTSEVRKKIVNIYMSNVHGKKADTTGSDPKHSGKEGHWLEKQMGVKPNASNTPDLYGYEMKNHSDSVVTLGSWDPNDWIFRNPQYGITRDDFLKIFGKANPLKNNRMSWSGTPVPKIGVTNSFGMRISVSAENSVIFFYSFTNDKRDNKNQTVPKNLQIDNLEICRWNSTGKKSLYDKLEKKFNQNGWFTCFRDEHKTYNSIAFGRPITFETFMKYFKTGKIYFDCGMYQGNNRNYCQWRAANTFWDSLIVETYPE